MNPMWVRRFVLANLLLTTAACSPVVPAGSDPVVPATLVAVPHSDMKKLSGPVRCGEFLELSGDPSVLRDGNQFRMFCTGLDKKIRGGGIAQATSPDGMNWATVTKGDVSTGLGLVLRGQKDRWDHQLETANAIKVDDGYLLYYSGYPKVGWPKNPGQIGVAKSVDGLNFSRISDKPILAPTPKWYDSNGLYSPVVFRIGDEFGMVYAGHNYSTTAVPAGIYLLGATSIDGVNWIKRAAPILSPSDDYWFTKHGVAEADLLRTPDGKYYLLFTGALGDDEKRIIAVARADSPFGPFQIRRAPLLEGTPGMFDEKGVLAPTAILEDDVLKLWYLTSDGDRHMTGYAEISWPLTGW
jgi:hypothetical protein